MLHAHSSTPSSLSISGESHHSQDHSPPSSGGSHDTPRYRGVRKRKWGKWVAEIREPHKRSRIWLGSYFSAQAAAIAFDVAAYCLRGPSANMNLPDLLPSSVRTVPCSQLSQLSPKSVQKLALAAGSMADISATARFGAINSLSQSAASLMSSSIGVGRRGEGSFTKPPPLSIAPVSSFSIKTSHSSTYQAPADHVAQPHWLLGAKLEVSPNPTVAQLAHAMLLAPPSVNEQRYCEEEEAFYPSLWQF